MTYTFRLQNQVYRVELEEYDNHINVQINGESIPLEYQKLDDNLYSLIIKSKSYSVGIHKNGKMVQVFMEGDLFELEAVPKREKVQSSSVSSGVHEINSPMPSRVVKILKNVDDEVHQDEGVIVVEAMKMESELKSPINGKVTELNVEEGQAVESGMILLKITAE